MFIYINLQIHEGNTYGQVQTITRFVHPIFDICDVIIELNDEMTIHKVNQPVTEQLIDTLLSAITNFMQICVTSTSGYQRTTVSKTVDGQLIYTRKHIHTPACYDIGSPCSNIHIESMINPPPRSSNS